MSRNSYSPHHRIWDPRRSGYPEHRQENERINFRRNPIQGIRRTNRMKSRGSLRTKPVHLSSNHLDSFHRHQPKLIFEVIFFFWMSLFHIRVNFCRKTSFILVRVITLLVIIIFIFIFIFIEINLFLIF